MNDMTDAQLKEALRNRTLSDLAACGQAAAASTERHIISELLPALLKATQVAIAAERTCYRQASRSKGDGFAPHHGRLRVLVPACRKLRVYLAQLRTGQDTRNFRFAPAVYLSVMYQTFVKEQLHVPDDHDVWAIPVSRKLLYRYADDIGNPEVLAAAGIVAKDLVLLPLLEGVTLGELRDSHRLHKERARRQAANAQHAEQVRFEALQAKLKDYLSEDDYTLLHEWRHHL